MDVAAACGTFYGLSSRNFRCLYGLVAHRAYNIESLGPVSRAFVRRGDDNWILAFRALAFLAGVDLRNSNTLAAVLAVELYLIRVVRYNARLAALRTFDPLA